MKLRLLTELEAHDYKNIISGYHPSAQTVYEFARSRFAVITGTTGAGKDTLRNALLGNSEKFVAILSTTSRPMRPGEEDGVQYHFRELSFFDEGFDQKRFFQAAIIHNQQIACLDLDEIHKLNSDQTGVSILVVQTEIELRALNPGLKTVFVVPPSLAVLRDRMQSGRNESEEEVARRMVAAKTELEIALRQPSYCCIINDDIEAMRSKAEKFLIDGEIDQSSNQQARERIAQILQELTGV